MANKLVEYAKSEFQLNKTIKGSTLREHLENIATQTGTIPDQLLNVVQIPTRIQYIFGWFLELNAARQYNESGFSLLSYSEIKAWDELTMKQITPYELDIIKRIDIVFSEVMQEK